MEIKPAPDADRAYRRAIALLSMPHASLLLDLDGTLIDSEPMHREAYRQYFASRHWDVSDDTIELFTGRRGEEAFADIEGPWLGEDPLVLTDEVESLAPQTGIIPTVIPGATQAITHFIDSGGKVCIVTSALVPWAHLATEYVIPDKNIRDKIAFVTAEDSSLGKPDPTPFRLGLEKINADPARTVAIEDTPAGIHSAVGAGVGVVLGITTSHDAQFLQDVGAHGSISSFHDLMTN